MPGVANGAQDKQPVTAKWTPDKDEQVDLDAIDAKLQRLRDHITVDPYVMTIPQDVEPRYHHLYEAQAKQWLYSTPFEEGEHEATQYLTFHYHEPGKEMYMLHNSRPIKESSANGGREKSRPGTGTNTLSTGIKKKISFSAYKKGKQTVEVVTPEREAVKSEDAPAKQPAVKGPVERVKAETQDMLAAVAEDTEVERKVEKEKSPEQGDLKRRREERKEVGNQEIRTVKEEAEPGHKKQRIGCKVTKDEPRQPQKEEKSTASAQPVKGNKHQQDGLPTRLSPVIEPQLPLELPERLSPLPDDEAEESGNLPSRLSPSIPDNIVKALAARTHSWTGALSSTIVKDKDGKLTPTKKAEGINKHRSPVPRNGNRATSSSPAVRTDVGTKSAAITSLPGAKSPRLSQDNEIMVAKAVKGKKVEKASTAERPTLLVRLNYKRARKEDILRILKMRSRPDKSMLVAASTTEEPKSTCKATDKRNDDRKEDSAKSKGVAQKVGPVKREKKPVAGEYAEKEPEKVVSKQADKRPAKPPQKPTSPKRKPEDDKQAPPAKRRKLEPGDIRKEPSTPAQRGITSPVAPRSGQHNTPGTRKDILSQAMKRDHSQDSNATHTPPATSSTPSVNGAPQVNGANRPPSSQPNIKTPRQNAFELEQKRLETLGRDLKYSATAHANHSQALNDQKLAAVKSVESFLCYLLAFTCADEAAASADPKQVPAYRTWRSLNGLYAFVRRTTDAFAPLSGLINSLGVVFNSHILEISTLVAEPPSQTTLVNVALLLQRAVAGAEEKLDIDALQDSFPQCWKERAKKMPPVDKVEPMRLGGQYKLPLGPATSPLRAARAGHAMLREWMEREKIDYSLKLKL